ncbi:predicted protein [Nematostella vectensis]|uniref:Uncharacterized protein n=1 Tax=Nematostella vectensis TaxID=45351 RepID=A7RN44_NEMVE|nr:uncharacterized protein LOC5519169 [Nematostella vectensis]EDO47004.1 predicted protein [Nematostella vectensis]|eukprot:XP_001639067.1 predicted protein [Nematostella vectensis]
MMSFFSKLKMSKSGNSKETESSLYELVNQMGYPKDVAESELKKCNNDLSLAKKRLVEKYGNSSSSMPPAYSNEPPPPYSEKATEPVASSNVLLYVKQEKTDLLKDLQTSFPQQEERCCSCFDIICPDPDEGFTGESVWQGQKAYHTECYLKNKGPRCEHCCFALIAFPSKGLSGRWGIYSGKKYHEECYTLYAGPRCSSCCDVIAPNPDEGYSGRCQEDNNKLYHEECFTKKNLAEYKAKYS